MVPRLLVGAVAAIVATGVAGCTDTNPELTSPDAATSAGVGGEHMLGHVHGLGTDPADGTLYIASHLGVFELGDNGDLTRIADRYQDTMAFIIAGPQHFLASGHPDLREDLPAHLGLIESTDAAQTWRPVSLQGQADFHALEVAGPHLYGYDSASQTLMVTTNRRRWQVVDRAALVDITADPADTTRLLATTPVGRVVEYDTAAVARDPAGQNAPVDVDAPPLLFLDWVDGEGVGALTAAGTPYLSRDGGRSWQRLTGVPGEAQALDATPRAWHVATSTGVYRSTDGGQSWERIAT